jgi:peptide chain release factor 2
MAAPNFWNNQEKAQETIAAANALKGWLEPAKTLEQKLENAAVLFELADEADESADAAALEADLTTELDQTEKLLGELEVKRMLGGPSDAASAIVSINAGAGGTEACDWAEMLLRMYKRWADDHGYEMHIDEILAGEEAGIKNVTFHVRGPNAYGYLKAERGVHRLVRISPYDANKRRHTSFASVDVAPEVADDIDIEINEGDLRIDTYRAGGHGGQHVNKTDSAVRITHLPTGVVAACQNERSQLQNKTVAMKLLRGKLYQAELDRRAEKLQKEYGQKKRIEWGSQIRSYVFQPYTLVKDHRTGVEHPTVQAVMDGDLDRFIHAYLKEFGGN